MANIKSINGNPIVVGTSGIEDNAVTAAKLAEGAVTTPKLSDGAVTDAKLAQSGGVLEKVGDLESAIDTKAPAITDTASGAIASFDDGADDMPVKKLVANIEPVQDLHGYDSPWPAGGGTNIIPIGTDTSNGFITNRTIDASGSVDLVTSGYDVSEYFEITAGVTYSLCIYPAVRGVGIGFAFYDSNKQYLSGADLGADETGICTLTADSGAVYCRASKSKDDNNYQTLFCRGSIRPTAWTPYSNICPISGWTGAEIEQTGKNLLPRFTYEGSVYGITYSVLDDGSVRATGTSDGASIIYSPAFVLGAGTYVLSGCQSGGAIGVRYMYALDMSNNVLCRDIGDGATFTIAEERTMRVCIDVRAAAGNVNLTFYPQLELGSTATDYEPYTGDQISVTFPDEAGTVYGGTLDVTNGKLTVDRAMVDLGTLTWDYRDDGAAIAPYFRANIAGSRAPNNSEIINGTYPTVCSRYAYVARSSSVFVNGTYAVDNATILQVQVKNSAYTDTTAFKAAMSGVQLVYELATPIEYQLTPQEVTTLLGTNNIWADTGDVEVTYPVDTKLYIDSKITQAIANALNS